MFRTIFKTCSFQLTDNIFSAYIHIFAKLIQRRITLNSIIGSLGNSIFYNLLNWAQSYSNPGEWQNKSRADFFYFQRDSLNQLTKFLFQRYHIKIPPEVFIIFEIQIREDSTRR